MIYSVFNSGDVCPGLAESQMELRAYCAEDVSEKKRPAILFLPGGGYKVNSPTEGEPAAIEFLHKGYQCFVLNYSLSPIGYPTQLLEAAYSMLFIRKNSAVFGVDGEEIAVCGFSAGGHLAGCLCNLWNTQVISENIGAVCEEVKPNAGILCYPVITAKYGGMSFENLGVSDGLSEKYRQLSLEKSVNNNTPPCFIWHTCNDPIVSVEHSLLFAKALQETGIPFEIHVFHDGPHAMSVCTKQSAWRESAVNLHAGHWVDLCSEWLSELYAKK